MTLDSLSVNSYQVYQKSQNFNSSNLNFGSFTSQPAIKMASNWGINNSSMPMFTSTSSSSGTTDSSDSGKTREEALKKAKEKKLAKTELANVKKDIKELKATKKSDGTAQMTPELSEMSFGKKLLRGGMRAFSGFINLFKQFVGFDAEGKWHWDKCLRNVAIAAGTAALCVFAAPIGAAVASTLGGGAVAGAIGSAIAATPAVLGVVGLGSGLYMTGRGAVNLCKADTTEEFDKACEDIGTGVTVTMMAGKGLKSMGAAMPESVASNNFLGKTFVDPFKACNTNYQTALVRVDKFGVAKTFGKTYKDFKTAPAKRARKDFEKSKNEKITNIEKQITDIDTQIQNPSCDSNLKASLELRKTILDSKLNSLKNAKLQADWQSIKTSNKNASKVINDWIKQLKKGEAITVNNKTYNPSKELINYLKMFNKSHGKLASDLNALVNLRYSSMFKMSNNKDLFVNDLKDFGWADKNIISRSASSLFSLIKLQPGKMAFEGFNVITDWQFAPGRLLAHSPAAPGLFAQYVFDPSYTPSNDLVLSAEEFNTKLAELESKKKTLESMIA